MDKPTEKQIVRDTQGIKDALFDALDELRSGKIQPPKANAIAKQALGILATTRLEMDFKKLQVALGPKLSGRKPPTVKLSD